MSFEYKVVPAPTRGRRAKGVKTPADRFARALEDTINELAAEGWEYLRTDTLPAEERQGLTGRTTVYQNMLVFRRAIEAVSKATERTAAAPPPPAPPSVPKAPTAPEVTAQKVPLPDAETETAQDAEAAETHPQTARGTGLDSLIAQELAAVRAPRLPSAGAAQEPAEPRTGPALPKLTASRKDMAAE